MNESQEQTLIDGISALMIFCKSPELRAQGQLGEVFNLVDAFEITELWQL